jgi:DNA-binding MurR/RpiR family transcriptional regulator
MSDIIEQLTAAAPELPKKLAAAARYALDNPERIAFDSMRTVASSAGVASPTMLRLARSLGFDSYDEFRGEFQRAVSGPGFAGRADQLRLSFSGSDEQALIASIAEAASANIAQMLRDLDTEAVDEFTTAIRSAPRTFVLGVGSMHWMAGLFETTGMVALQGLRCDHSGHATGVEMIASITERDVILAMAISPYARRTVEAARFARERGAKVFCITDRRSSPLVSLAHRSFIAPCDSPHYYPSFVSVVLTMEMLLAKAVAGAESTDGLRLFDEARRATGEFIE